MKSLPILCLSGLCLLAGPSSTASTIVIRNTPDQRKALGYLDTSFAEWGFGILSFEGARFRLAGFDYWEYAWLADRVDAHMCLIIHPVNPWIVGYVIWWGDVGQLDIFSTDGQRIECEVTVIRTPDPPANENH